MARNDFAVSIGRLEPASYTDITFIQKALATADRAILIVGSSFQARSPRNPLFFAERDQMVRGVLTTDENARLDIIPLPDSYNTHAWITAVRSAVRATSLARGLGPNPKVALIGHSREQSSYLSMFPGWELVEVSSVKDVSAILTQSYLEDSQAALQKHKDAFPKSVISFLTDFAATEDYAWLAAEAEWYRARQRKFAELRHLPPIVTTEAVVIQSGHVLLVERGKRPGLGLLSLPGDTLRDETFLVGILRVLVDDLRLMVTDTRPPRIARSTVEGRIVADEIFDHPHRSERGHLISRTYLIELHDDVRGLPQVGKGTDTQRPFWAPIVDIDPQTMFEDRYHVLNALQARTKRR